MTVTEILQKAAERTRQSGLQYSGALTPAEAYEVWRGVPGASRHPPYNPHADQLMRPVYPVARTITPNAMRYHAKALKSWVAM